MDRADVRRAVGRPVQRLQRHERRKRRVETPSPPSEKRRRRRQDHELRRAEPAHDGRRQREHEHLDEDADRPQRADPQRRSTPAPARSACRSVKTSRARRGQPTGDEEQAKRRLRRSAPGNARAITDRTAPDGARTRLGAGAAAACAAHDRRARAETRRARRRRRRRSARPRGRPQSSRRRRSAIPTAACGRSRRRRCARAYGDRLRQRRMVVEFATMSSTASSRIGQNPDSTLSARASASALQASVTMTRR